MNHSLSSVNLTDLAKQAMIARNLDPNQNQEVQNQLDTIKGPAQADPHSPIKDMRDKLWFSLDNDDSKDLDQLTYAEKVGPDHYKIYVAIADVDSIVKKDSPIDRHAQQNTTSVYTPTKVFPMLPEKLSTNLTSLNENEDRLAMVAEVELSHEGEILNYDLYPAIVQNKAKLAYDSVSDWLDGKGPIPQRITQVPGMEEQIKLQDEIAQILKNRRHQQGSLTLDTIEAQPVINNQQIVDMKDQPKNRGRELIEEFMIAANTATARFLTTHNYPSLRRVVRTPRRWDRIVEVAKTYGVDLPKDPDVKALEAFLSARKEADPLHFPDLSLTVIKLLGSGEYVVDYPNQTPVGHFSLAVEDYAHSTAPNRRYPDLITQRLLKAAVNKQPSPYTPNELEYLAHRSTEMEDQADKVERQMRKSAAIVLLSSKIGQVFDALVTGAGPKGTWVRILQPPVEGKLVQGFEHVDVGDKIKVKLVHVDLEKGFIDFIKV